MCAKSHTEFHPMYLFSSDLKVRVLPCANRERLISERNMLSVVSQRHVMITREMENLVLLFFSFFVYMYQFKRILRTIAIKNWLPALISANSRHSSQQVNLFYMYGCMKVFFSTQRWKLTVLYVCTRTHYTCYL